MNADRLSLSQRFRHATSHLHALVQDAVALIDGAQRDGTATPILRAVAHRSLPVLCLMRGAAALRALVGSSLGLSSLLARGYDVVVESDRIGGGLRLPSPRGIVIREGARIGQRCTLMNDVVIQGGATVGEGAVLGARTAVFGGARIGEYGYVMESSVVRGSTGRGSMMGGGQTPRRRAEEAVVGDVSMRVLHALESCQQAA